MTRKEALEKVPLTRWYADDSQRGWLLDSLIELGLLRLDTNCVSAFPPINEDFLVNCRSYEMDRVVVTTSGSVWGRMSNGQWRSLP